MTDQTMIERVARVLCAQNGDDPDAWEQRGQPNWKTEIENAKAILGIMRYPTEDMQFAACNELMAYGYQPAPIEAGLAYTAAIDAALAEE